MSEPEDFLARWSRRKHHAADEVDDTAAAAEPNTAESVADGDKSLDKEKRPQEPSEPLFDPASLPSIESITAETDIRAFLAPGVPAELARAALRRAWAADPKIRDFVGLADYAWDFHTPGAMAGFGPLEMTDALRREIVGMLTRGQPGEKLAETPPPLASGNAEQTLQRTSLDQATEPGPCQKAATNDQDETQPRKDLIPRSKHDTAAQHPPEKQASPKSMVQRGHGGALPKS